MRVAVRDWKCPSCGYKLFDVPDDRPVKPCPIDGTKMEKVWSAPTTLFKGDGWTPRFHN